MPSLTSLVAVSLSALIAVPVLTIAGISGPDPTCPPAGGPSPSLDRPPSGPAPDGRTSTAGTPASPTWDDEQRANAATIIIVGRAKNVPPRGWVIAIATAIQESRLRNLPGGDLDSIGLFQQRPSTGWGTPTQLTSPTYQAGTFYDALLAVPNWQHLALTNAAQVVQRSAFPDAYAQWEPAATALVADTTATGTSTALFAAAVNAAGCAGGLPTSLPAALPAGFTLPIGTPAAVITAISWALAQQGTPYSWGGDCTNPHSTNPAHQCDCSSLTQAAYRAAHIPLPRTTLDQVNAGVPVPDLDHARPGDLIFIPGSQGTARTPRHVALYLGQHLAIHAPRTGQNVQIVNITNWQPNIAAIRRPVPG